MELFGNRLSVRVQRVPILISASRSLLRCTSAARTNVRLHMYTAHNTYHSTPMQLAGHNKWSKIKRKKAVADLERSKVISKVTSQIVSAVRHGGNSDPNTNMQLASILSQAKNAGVAKSTVENAIRAGSKQSAAQEAESVLYEGRGPSGYLLLIETLTDNRKRTRPEIRHILEKYGGILGEPGSSSFMFEHKGVIQIPKLELQDGSDPLELAIEVGAEDVISKDGEMAMEECLQLICEPNELKSVSDAVRRKGLTVTMETWEYIPTSYVPLVKESFEKALKVVDILNEHNDVMEVYSNFTLE